MKLPQQSTAREPQPKKTDRMNRINRIKNGFRKKNFPFILSILFILSKLFFPHGVGTPFFGPGIEIFASPLPPAWPILRRCRRAI